MAAYCRVSTESEEQQTSYELQVKYYTEMITQNPDGEFVGVFADEESGGSMQRRKDFQRMLAGEDRPNHRQNGIQICPQHGKYQTVRRLKASVFRGTAFRYTVGGKRTDSHHVTAAMRREKSRT